MMKMNDMQLQAFGKLVDDCRENVRRRKAGEQKPLIHDADHEYFRKRYREKKQYFHDYQKDYKIQKGWYGNAADRCG